MATTQGDVLFASNSKRACCLFTGVTNVTGQPALVTDGVPVYPDETIFSKASGVCDATRPARESSIHLKVVGTTPSATFRLWGYITALAEWVPIGVGGDTTKGTLNGGAALGATKANKILHCEPFLLAGHFDRLFLEVVALSGAGATAEAWIVCPRTVSF